MLQLEKNIKNKTWWIAIISAVLLLASSHGVDLTKYIGTNWQDTLNTIFGLLVLLGVSVDTTTIKSDEVVSNATVQAVNAINTQETVQAESSTTDINNTVSENSASAKINVDNPDNTQVIGQEVNATSAATPK